MSSVVANAWEGAYRPKFPISPGTDARGWRRYVAEIGRVLNPLLKLWIRFGEAIGAVMSRVLLTVLYFFVVGPLSLYLKLVGNDLLELEADAKATTYWKPPRSANRRDRHRRQY